MARMNPKALLQQSKKKKSPSSMINGRTILVCALLGLLALFCLYKAHSYYFFSRSRQLNDDVRKSIHEGGGTSGDSKKSDFQYAILSTTKGSISVKLFKDSSPETVQRFILLSQKGHFKGMPFHHVVKHYVIQAGDPDKAGVAEEWTINGKHKGQLDGLEHEAFMIGTSKEKQDDKNFELFITTAPIPHLNEKLIVFGHVVKGQDVVQEIEELDTDEHYRPKSTIKITSVALKEKI